MILKNWAGPNEDVGERPLGGEFAQKRGDVGTRRRGRGVSRGGERPRCWEACSPGGCLRGLLLHPGSPSSACVSSCTRVYFPAKRL